MSKKRLFYTFFYFQFHPSWRRRKVLNPKAVFGLVQLQCPFFSAVKVSAVCPVMVAAHLAWLDGTPLVSSSPWRSTQRSNSAWDWRDSVRDTKRRSWRLWDRSWSAVGLSQWPKLPDWQWMTSRMRMVISVVHNWRTWDPFAPTLPNGDVRCWERQGCCASTGRRRGSYRICGAGGKTADATARASVSPRPVPAVRLASSAKWIVPTFPVDALRNAVEIPQAALSSTPAT